MTGTCKTAMSVVLCHVLGGCATLGTSRATQHDESPLAALAWLSGSWFSEPDERGVITEEHWTSPRGGSMIGMNRAASGDRTVFFEFLRIESRADGVHYLASPAGRHPPTPFALIQSGGTKAVFENPDHDFPQRITYERRGNELLMSTRGEFNGQARQESWRLRRVTQR